VSVRILIGDCVERMRELPDNSVDSVVCDPPYHLTSIVKRFGAANAAPAQVGKTGAYARASKGFMGQTWDGGDVAFQPETWAEVLRVLKPGGHLVAFSGTRTYHRMAVAIEDAGFEVRDMLEWLYSTGFPKSHNIDKAISDDERCCCPTLPERDLRLVRDTDVSPPINAGDERGEVLFAGLPQQGPSDSVLRAEPAQVSSDAQEPCVEGRRDAEADARQLSGREVSASAGMGAADGASGRLHNAAPPSDGADVRLPADANGSGEPQGSQPGEQSPVEPGAVADERGSQARGSRALCRGCGKPIVETGLGTALKPSHEPICLARKPLSEKSIAANVLKWGTGALNIDGCRIETDEILNGGAYAENGTKSERSGSLAGGLLKSGIGEYQQPQGRWPANLCHDGSDEVVAGFPTSTGGHHPASRGKGGIGNDGHSGQSDLTEQFDDEGGSAARFFYCAKATAEDRKEYNNHPTVKPEPLMRWLVRLVTPKGGTVLDPFMGSGSTLIAADAEQFNAIGCEISPEYAAIAERRIRDAAGMFADISVERCDQATRAA
jgi:DNA modification methylase